MKFMLLLFVAFFAACATQRAAQRQPAPTELHDLHAPLSTAPLAFDLYLPASPTPAPLVMVAHGFLRSKSNMAGWGRALSSEGFVAAVPNLPTYSDHAANGKAIGDLMTWLCATTPYAARINPHRIGCMGFSAGGLATLLAAADHPEVQIWVGLDPVDRDGIGLAALPRLHAQPVILRANPSAWNADGNCRTWIAALGPRCQTYLVDGAIHIDAEWPTDALAEWAVGKSTQAHRQQFATHALAALKSALLP